MARCVVEGCEENAGLLHLFRGAAGYPISKTTDYTGASFCSWQHLADWLDDASHATFDVPMLDPKRRGVVDA